MAICKRPPAEEALNPPSHLYRGGTPAGGGGSCTGAVPEQAGGPKPSHSERRWSQPAWARLAAKDPAGHGRCPFTEWQCCEHPTIAGPHKTQWLVQRRAGHNQGCHRQASPFRPRPVPYILRSRVDQALEKLEVAGIIEPADFSEWAAPIVPVVKRDGTIRVCVDYKLTVKQVAQVDDYPLPLVDSLFASLAGGKSFSKLDLAHVYQQL